MADIREDKRELDGQIRRIAGLLADVLPEGWTRAAAGYFLVGEDKSEQMQVVALTGDGEDFVDIMDASFDDFDLQDGVLELQEEFGKLYRLCRAAGDSFTEATLVLKRSGNFEMKFSYEPIHEYDNFFADDWKSSHLLQE